MHGRSADTPDGISASEKSPFCFQEAWERTKSYLIAVENK